MGESRVNFSRVIKGTQEPFKATIYVESLGGGDHDCTLTELEFKGKKKIERLGRELEAPGANQIHSRVKDSQLWGRRKGGGGG